MRKSNRARSTLTLLSLSGVAVLAACSGDVTAPSAAPLQAAQSTASSFTPSAATRALVGVSDGTYEFTVDPRHDRALVLGENYLSLPANSICDLKHTSYGVTEWRKPCEPERKPVKITAVVRNASSDNPSIDFYPALRFNPATKVTLTMSLPQSSEDNGRGMVINYCNDLGVCIDESLADPSLRTYTDEDHGVVFREIRHFSGYLVSSDVVSTASALY